jgi:hypothetical protein
LVTSQTPTRSSECSSSSDAVKVVVSVTIVVCTAPVVVDDSWVKSGVVVAVAGLVASAPPSF